MNIKEALDAAYKIEGLILLLEKTLDEGGSEDKIQSVRESIAAECRAIDDSFREIKRDVGVESIDCVDINPALGADRPGESDNQESAPDDVEDGEEIAESAEFEEAEDADADSPADADLLVSCESGPEVHTEVEPETEIDAEIAADAEAEEETEAQPAEEDDLAVSIDEVDNIVESVQSESEPNSGVVTESMSESVPDDIPKKSDAANTAVHNGDVTGGEPVIKDVNDMIFATKASVNLRRMFSLNDKFRFRRELFGNSDRMFSDALDLVEAMKSTEEAESYFFEDLSWNPDNETVKEFMKIVNTYLVKK